MTELSRAYAYQLLSEGRLAFARAERKGICIDVPYCRMVIDRLNKKAIRLEKKFAASKLGIKWAVRYGARTNHDSHPQLAVVLYKDIGYPISKHTGKSGRGSTDESALKSLGNKDVLVLLKKRKLEKTRGVLEGFLKEQVGGRMHPNFNLHTARTYRSSCSSPNFQNIPKRDKEARRLCRKAIIPSPGNCLMEVDYSGLEVSISACYHKDPEMLRYLNDPSSDMHLDMAKELFFLDSKNNHLRSAAKNGFVFPQFYGDYHVNCAKSLACAWCGLPASGEWERSQGVEFNGGNITGHLISHGIRSLEDFTEHVRKVEENFWQHRFKVYGRWRDRWWEKYRRKGYIDLLTGFRCSGLMRRNEVINYPVQGAAFHCLLWSFIMIDRIMRREKWKTRLVGQIHDSLVLDVHPDEIGHVAQVVLDVTCRQLLKAWKWIIVPLSVEFEVSPVDGSWVDLEPYHVEAA